jgi:hypothetical protein
MKSKSFEVEKKRDRGYIYCLLMLLLLSVTNIFAQQTNNLEVIWQKTSSDSVFYFGRCITSGDVNDDGFSDVMIVGDSIVGPYPYRGKCWIFYGGQNFDTVSDVQLLNTEQNIFWSVTSGDINGDGFSDVILGACNNAGGYGEVLLFLGGNPMGSTCDYRITGGPYQGSNFGCAVSTGDINGDGYKDLIVGAYTAFVYPVGDLAGRVYIYFGGPNFDINPDVILNGGHNNEPEGFGYTVSGRGDVNNDGFDDVIIGAPNFGSLWQGRIYIYFGANPMNTVYDVAMIGEETDQSIGLCGVDFLKNHETYDNAVFGSPLWGPLTPPDYQPGKVYILFGGNSMDSIPDVCMIGRTDSSWLGISSSSAGYISGQLFKGLIVGAPVEHNQSGTAYLWLGGPLLDTIPDAWLRGTFGNSGIGCHVASAGDVDSDGRDEIMVSNSWAGWPMKVWVCKYTGVGIEENRQPLTAIYLPLEVYPNPARAFATIRLPRILKLEMLNQIQHDNLAIKIYDVSGKLVKILDKVDSRQNTKYKEIRWDLRDDKQKRVANGIYFVEATTDEADRRQNTEHRKIIREIRKIVITKQTVCRIQ